MNQANLLVAPRCRGSVVCLALGEGAAARLLRRLRFKAACGSLASGGTPSSTALTSPFPETDRAPTWALARKPAGDFIKCTRNSRLAHQVLALVAAGIEHVLSPRRPAKRRFDRLPGKMREALPSRVCLRGLARRRCDTARCNLPKKLAGKRGVPELPMTPLGVHACRRCAGGARGITGTEQYKQLHNQVGRRADRLNQYIAAIQHFQKAGGTGCPSSLTEIIMPED